VNLGITVIQPLSALLLWEQAFFHLFRSSMKKKAHTGLLLTDKLQRTMCRE